MNKTQLKIMACTLGCICLAACAEPQGESSPSPLPTSIPASTTATTSISPTVEAATEVLLNYVDEENIVAIATYLQHANITITCLDFEEVIISIIFPKSM